MFAITPFFFSPQKAVNVSNNKNKEDIYMRCIASSFHSLKLHSKNTKVGVFSNKNITCEPFGFDSIGCEVFVLDSSCFQMNYGFVNDFPGCLFLIDVLIHCQEMGFNEDLLVVDSDIIFNGDIESVFGKKKNITFYQIEYDDAHLVNGQSVNSLTKLLKEYTGKESIKVTYVGGEILFVPTVKLEQLIEEIKKVADFLNLKGVSNITEEHLLTLAVNSIGEFDLCNDICKRIWNTGSYSNVSNDDWRLKILHMPAEKQYGFQYYFNVIENNGFNDGYGVYLKGIKGFSLYRFKFLNLFKKKCVGFINGFK